MSNTNNTQERSGLITFKGNPLTLQGAELKVGDTAPNFSVVDNGLQPVQLKDFAGKFVLLSVTPSLDTPVCDLQAKKFNTDIPKLSDDVVVLNISVDLPFALGRWCGATNSEKIQTLSDYQERDFALKYGVLIKELKLLARSIWLIDKEGKIRYIEFVKENTDEPNYEKALEELKKLL